eukprot:gene15876-18868_t
MRARYTQSKKKTGSAIRGSSLGSFAKTQQIRSFATAAPAPAVNDIKVPTTLIQELRKRTSAPITDCKRALQNNENDIDKAIAWLLEKGKATAVKLQSRVSMEGVISVLVSNNKAVILEMNSETDFVSRGDSFRTLARDISSATIQSRLLGAGDISPIDIGAMTSTLDVPVEDSPAPVKIADAIVRSVARLRENLLVRRAAGIESHKPNVIISGYAHDPQGTRQQGRLGAIIAIEFEGQPADKAALKQFADELAVHIVGVGPLYVSIESVPASVLEEAVAAKRHPNSLYDEVVLLEQKFITGQDGESVKEAVERLSKKLNTTITIKSFVRYAVGEGMEKKEEDYQAEVMSKINAAAGKN